MAKIGKHTFSINGAATDQYFTVDLHYSTKRGDFIAYIPAPFVSKLDNLSSEAQHKMCISTATVQGERKHIFYAKSEEALKDTLYHGCKTLIEMAAEKRPVILIWFRDDARPHWGADSNRNPEHDAISIYYTLTYATEERVNGGSPVYRMPSRSTFTLSSSRKAVVIDDTPEARVKLDDIYKLLKKLSSVLSEYTKDVAGVEHLINSSFKLLS